MVLCLREGHACFCYFVFAVAGMIKGTIGLGRLRRIDGSLILVISPFQAATLLRIIPSMVTNLAIICRRAVLATGTTLVPLLRA